MLKQFSFIIPTLNEEKLLPTLLKQLTGPDLKSEYNYEIIISDGGSKDSTVKIAEEFADVVITHNNPPKQNIAQGRNIGAQKAHGEILIFLNGDVRIKDPKLFLKIINEKFYKSKFLAMTCKVEVFPEESKLIDKLFQSFYNYYFHFLNLAGLGMGRGECHVIPAEVFHDSGGYNTELAAGEDFELYKRLRRKGKILFERKLTVYESPRRYRKLGHFRILFTWLINSIYVFFMNKSLSKNWDEVR